MIISMTGFGRGEASANGVTAMVELKTLNSRYLDLGVRLPQRFQEKELQFKEWVSKEIARGKLNATVYLDDQETNKKSAVLDEQKLEQYTQILLQIKEKTGASGIDAAIQFKDLLHFNDLITHPEPEEDPEHDEMCWNLIKQANEQALAKLMEMKIQEGEQLRNDILNRIEAIATAVEHIRSITGDRAEEVRKKLLERMKALLEDEKIDKDRLEMEVTIMADKMDITEETVRLDAHLKFFIEAMNSKEHAGRRLNFLTQEINRELNTIGSKANDSAIAHEVVKAKEMLEQIREQVQNVE
jgi:uncharacterized protein (TIGR00255 family)